MMHSFVQPGAIFFWDVGSAGRAYLSKVTVSGEISLASVLWTSPLQFSHIQQHWSNAQAFADNVFNRIAEEL